MTEPDRPEGEQAGSLAGSNGRGGNRTSRPRGRSADLSALHDRLRDGIMARLHAGLLHAGDALPPIRKTAAEHSADPRAIMRCYRRLAATGLLEIRPRQGVYIPAHYGSATGAIGERIQWLTSVLVDARQRGISTPNFAEFMRTATRERLQCLVVEDVRDVVEAIQLELEEELGAGVTVITGKSSSAASAAADVIVTSAFCVERAHRLAVRWNKPIVVYTLATIVADIIRAQLASGGLTLLVTDLAFAERFRRVYAASLAEHDSLTVIRTTDRKAIALMDRTRPILATVSARRALPDLNVPLLVPRYPTMSVESARELVERTLRLNLGR